MSEKMYTRTGKTIESVERNEANSAPAYKHTFKSLNAAKKKSRQLQMDADGALGFGSVRVAR